MRPGDMFEIEDGDNEAGTFQQLPDGYDRFAILGEVLIIVGPDSPPLSWCSECRGWHRLEVVSEATFH